MGAPVALDRRPPVIFLTSAIPSYVFGLVTHKAMARVKTFAAVTVGAVMLNMPKAIAAEAANLVASLVVCGTA